MRFAWNGLLFASIAVIATWGCGGDGTSPLIPDGTVPNGSGSGSSSSGATGSGGAATVPANPLSLTGVNLSGAEFGMNIPGVFDTDYTYPGSTDIQYFSGHGMTVVRIPFLWERLQPTLGQSLDQAELGRLRQVVQLGVAANQMVVLDVHNYARYQLGAQKQLLGDGKLTKEHFADLWSRIATEFSADQKVAFGLMNEPHDMPTSDWVDSANAALSAIRATGATQLVLVGGNHWSGAHSWTDNDNAQAMLTVVDPMNHFAFDAHQYFDSDRSGTSEKCVARNADTLVGAFTKWLRDNSKQAFLGEFGGGSGEDCRASIEAILVHLEANRDVWVGWTYWSAGPWWGDYFSSLTPDGGADKPQMAWLKPHLPIP